MLTSTRNTIQLLFNIPVQLHSQNLSKFTRRLGIVFLLAFFALLFWLCVWYFPENAKRLNTDLIQSQFIKGPFIIQFFILLAWFIQSIKPMPARIDEYKLLISLPISPKQIFVRFIISDFVRSSWVLFLLSTTFLSLLPFSSFSFLSRPVLLSAILCLLNLSVSIFLNILLSIKGQNRKSSYLSKLNIFVQSVIFLVHNGCLLFTILIPLQASDLLFWIIVFIQFIVIFVLIILSAKQFSKIQQNNGWLKLPSFINDLDRSLKLSKFKIYWISKCKRNPLLVKNMIQGWRSNSLVSNYILVGFFIIISYSLAMNNDDISDRILILLGLIVLFLLFFSLVTMQRLNPELESTKIIFLLPINRFHQYVSILLPPLFVSLLISCSMCCFILIWSGDFLVSLDFLSNTFFAIFVILTAAVNFNLSSYPDNNSAIKKYIYWAVTMLISIAIFYKFRVLVISLFSIISFMAIRRTVRFRQSKTLTEQSFV